MKKISVLFASLLFCIPAIFAIGDYRQGDTLHVWAFHGLSLRVGASVGSAKLVTLPYGAKIVVLDSVRVKSFSVNEYPGFTLKGHWSKVRFGIQEGFVFDGYLSHFPVFRKETNTTERFFEDFAAYATREFGLAKKQKLELETDKVCRDCSNYREIYTFKNGMVYEIHRGTGDGGWTVLHYQIPDLSFEEAYLWFVYNDGLHRIDPRHNSPGVKPENAGFQVEEKTSNRLKISVELCTYSFEKKGKKMFVSRKCSC